MDEEQKAIEPEIVEAPKVEEKPRVRMQYVFITLADGRRGVFAGPELITKAELLLKPPTLVDLVFSEPKEVEKPTIVDAEIVKTDETQKA